MSGRFNQFELPGAFNNNYQLDKNYKGGAGATGIIKKYDSPGRPSIIVKKFRDPFNPQDRSKLIESALNVLRELNLLRCIRHENIVRFLGSYTLEGEKDSIYHITEYCGMPLSKRIEKGDYDMEAAKKWTRELLRAIQHLHSNGVIHRNLQPGNMCIDDRGKLTLIGFGKARALDNNRNSIYTRRTGLDPYSPLEMFVEYPYTEKVDIWSVACVLCELLTGSVLFDSKHSTMKKQIEYCGGVDEPFLAKVGSEQNKRDLSRCSANASRKDFIDILLAQMKPKRTISEDDIRSSEFNLKGFLDNTLQLDPSDRFSAQRALCLPFLLGIQPWKQKLPDNDEEAMKEIKHRIESELVASPPMLP